MADIDNIAIDAFEEAIASHTVGIIGTKDGKEGAGIGTGAAVLWQERAIILTAWHVIKESPSENIWLLFRPKGTLVRYVTGRRPPASPPGGRYLRESIAILNVVKDERLDISAIEVPLCIKDQHPVQFHQLDAQRAVAPTGTDVLLTGHPSALAQPVGSNFEVFANHEYTSVTEDRPLGFRGTNREFFMKWSSASDWDPYGFSGSGVWFDATAALDAASVWTPCPALAGIATSYFSRSELMMALQIDTIKEFLRSTLG